MRNQLPQWVMDAMISVGIKRVEEKMMPVAGLRSFIKEHATHSIFWKNSDSYPKVKKTLSSGSWGVICDTCAVWAMVPRFWFDIAEISEDLRFVFATQERRHNFMESIQREAGLDLRYPGEIGF